MSHLQHDVAAFIRQTERDGGIPKPGALEWLKGCAARAFDGCFAALHAPMAPYTWEVAIDLPGLEANSSPEIGSEFKGPVEVLGFFPSLVDVNPAADAAFAKATLDDVLVKVDVNQQDRFTNRNGIGSVVDQAGGFVTLGSLAVQTPRLVAIRMRVASPVMTFSFRWKVPPVGGVKRYRDTRVSIAEYCRYL